MVFSTARDSQLHASFTSLLRESQYGILDNDMTGPKQAVDDKLIGRTIHQNATSALSAGRHLIAEYRRVCAQVAAREGDLKSSQSSESDSQTLQDILKRQGEKAKAEVCHLLHDHTKDSANQYVDEADHDLWKRFALTSTQGDHKSGTDPGEGWAFVVGNAQRAVERMVRHLPGDDESQRS